MHLLKNGAKYINIEVWINDDKEPDNYGNNCGVKQAYKVADKEYQSHYIGNGKTVLGIAKVEQANQEQNIQQKTEVEDDLPF